MLYPANHTLGLGLRYGYGHSYRTGQPLLVAAVYRHVPSTRFRYVPSLLLCLPYPA